MSGTGSKSNVMNYGDYYLSIITSRVRVLLGLEVIDTKYHSLLILAPLPTILRTYSSSGLPKIFKSKDN